MPIVLDSVYISGAGVSVTSEPIAMGPNNALAVGVTTIVAGTALTSVTVEGSNDKTNWGTSGISGPTYTPSLAAAPHYTSGIATSVGYAYARVKVTAAAASIVSVNAAPQKL